MHAVVGHSYELCMQRADKTHVHSSGLARSDSTPEASTTYCHYDASVTLFACRYEYQPEELGSMLEIMACMKGVAGLLQQAEVWLSGYLHQAMYAQMQHFVQLLLTHTSLGSQDKVCCWTLQLLLAITQHQTLALGRS